MMQESQRLKELIRTRTFASENLAVVRVSHDDGAYCGAAFMPDACYFVLRYTYEAETSCHLLPWSLRYCLIAIVLSTCRKIGRATMSRRLCSRRDGARRERTEL